MTQLPPSDLMRGKRAHQRVLYEKATIYRVLDAGIICHVGYVVDDQPLVTPTAYWRVEDAVYMHGSSASRLMKVVASGAKIAFTTSILDGLVMARSGFEHSINYRGVMAAGKGFEVEDPAEKTGHLERLIERVAPGRWRDIRQPSAKELKATKVVGLQLTNAAAKIHCDPVTDEPEDIALPVWAGVVPQRTVALEPVTDKDTPSHIPTPHNLSICPIKGPEEAN